MPELPEVETVVRGLRKLLVGRTITRVGIRWAGSIGAPDPDAFIKKLTGQVIADVSRRGKWVMIKLSGGHTLLVHLRMTGQLVLEPAACPEDKYTRVILHFDDGQRLRFSDMRKFGLLILTEDADEVLGELGPEPLAEDFTVELFKRMLAQRRGRIKPLLLNQRFLAGLGNIYANEALWRAGVHPLRSASSLSSREAAALHHAIRFVLGAAIVKGGTTLENGNFRHVDGDSGDFASQLEVYGRACELCPRCGTPVERIRVGQRSTFFCPCCQPIPDDPPRSEGDPRAEQEDLCAQGRSNDGHSPTV
ncbi:MAG: bifunctional DNA-formamidopyrimidine glycosylase/DNA-(apurinic or apyrimidinic site) lyase [Anaerolineae bacterium]|jgi:formamidopyrimidine-DNA glycosylase